MRKVAILNYSNGELSVINIPDDINNIKLYIEKEYDLTFYEWMLVTSIKFSFI